MVNKMGNDDGFRIVVDTREPVHTAYDFRNLFAPDGTPIVVPTVRAKLDSGDYSIEGMETRFAVERKELGDLLGCIGQSRARFTRELERLAAFEFAAVMVEADFRDLFGPRNMTQLHPSAIAGTIIAWSTRYGIPFFFAGGRHTAEKLTFRTLERCWRDTVDGKRPAARDKAIAGIPVNGEPQ